MNYFSALSQKVGCCEQILSKNIKNKNKNT